MNNGTATAAHGARRTRQTRRVAPQGRLIVGDYVGETAAEAARAIRRAGLRPGLERSLGCEPELLGQVVAQEPPAESELARNAMVILHVAAPALAAADEDPNGQLRASDPSFPSAAGAQAREPEADAAQARPRSRQSRKRRLADKPLRVIGAPPAPGRWERQPAPGPPALPSDACSTGQSISDADAAAPAEEEMGEGALGEEGTDEHEELVVQADDVFAGRAGASWRRVYPTGRGLARAAGGLGPRPSSLQASLRAPFSSATGQQRCVVRDPCRVERRWIDHRHRPAPGDSVEKGGVADLACCRGALDLHAVGLPDWG